VPWKVSSIVNQRMKFVLRLEQGERMSDLCREFGISRTTGYKFVERFKAYGPEGLFDESRRPQRSPHRTREAIVELLVAERQRRGWGARKLRKVLSKRHPGVKFPALSTISDILTREGLIKPRKRKRRVMLYPSPLEHARAPNDVWCADYKGQFRLGNGKYCYPLTISDAHSRFIIACEGVEATDFATARSVFMQAFRIHGLPRAIRTDNGTPFASRALYGLSRLSVLWRRLGILHERIEPGHPEQNGIHERMHRTLKARAISPAAANLLQQQERFDDFVEEFNQVRPHEALGDETPGSVYKMSNQRLPPTIPEPEYPLHQWTARVYPCGHLYMRGQGQRNRGVFITKALGNEIVGIRELDSQQWLVSFMDLNLGIIQGSSRKLLPPTRSSGDN